MRHLANLHKGFTRPMPGDCADGGKLLVRVWWYTAATTGNVRFWLQSHDSYRNNDGVVGATLETRLSGPGSKSTTNLLNCTVIDLQTITVQPGQMTQLKLLRKGTDSNDTLTADIKIVGLDVLYPRAL